MASDLIRALARDDDEGHLSYEQIEAWVDGRVSPSNRETMDAHLRQCRHCAEDLREIQAFAATMRNRPAAAGWRERFRNWWRVPRFAMAGSAAAVMFLLAVSFLLVHRPGREAVAVAPTIPPA